jgi:two-component system, OmpR family, sensor histidine kinase ChvG
MSERWRGWRSELARIRYRLLLVNVLIVSVPLLGIAFARFYEREMLRALEDDMIHQAAVVRQLVLGEGPLARLEDRQPMLAAAARDTRTRIRLLDATGAVAADSHAAGPPEGTDEGRGIAARPPAWLPLPAAPIDVAERPEVRAALAGRYGAATRVWRFEGGERVYLFSALPITGADGAPAGAVYVTRSTLPVLAAMHRLRGTLWAILWCALGATAVLTLFLATTIARPLSQLTERAHRIAAGDRRDRLHLERHDEIGELARAFDTMARRLDARAHGVAELAANVSHEFKSPLTSIRGAAELLRDGAADDPAARGRFLDNVLSDARRLDRLVTRLLELSRAEADTTPVEAFDYERLVRETAASVRGPFPVEVEYESARRTVRGRRPLLASVLGNLLDNACHHGRPGSAIRVRVDDVAADRLRTTVHNHGDAISPANLPRLWDRFFTTRGSTGGTGLGLSIVASIVRAHGGTVEVTSGSAEGTTFAFELPVR